LTHQIAQAPVWASIILTNCCGHTVTVLVVNPRIL
jgi:hypothetical protein